MPAGVDESISPSLREATDDDLVRLVSAEFRRRGYEVAIRLRSMRHTSHTREEGDGDYAAAVLMELAGGDGGPKTKEAEATALPSFAFYPCAERHNERLCDDAWDDMFEKLRSYCDEHGGALPVSRSMSLGEEAAALCAWTERQLSYWERMRSDEKHWLCLRRIRKLCSLGVEEKLMERREGELDRIASRYAHSAPGSNANADGGDERDDAEAAINGGSYGNSATVGVSKLQTPQKKQQRGNSAAKPCKASLPTAIAPVVFGGGEHCGDHEGASEKKPRVLCTSTAVRGEERDNDDDRKEPSERKAPNKQFEQQWWEKFEELKMHKKRYGK